LARVGYSKSECRSLTGDAMDIATAQAEVLQFTAGQVLKFANGRPVPAPTLKTINKFWFHFATPQSVNSVSKRI